MTEGALAAAAVPLDAATALLLGLSMGAGACALSCLPFVGLWMLGREGAGARLDAAWFSAGRVSAYTLLALAASLTGGAVAGTLALGLGQALLGAAALLAGLWLWRQEPGPGAGACRPQAGARGRRWHPFALGAALSLTPCAPLAAVLAHAAQAASVRTGIVVGLSFGSARASRRCCSPCLRRTAPAPGWPRPSPRGARCCGASRPRCSWPWGPRAWPRPGPARAERGR